MHSTDAYARLENTITRVVASGDWGGVRERYDKRCRPKFRQEHTLLSAVEPTEKDSDRSLYYWLRWRVDQSINSLHDGLDIGWYDAFIYWKHYSGRRGPMLHKSAKLGMPKERLAIADTLRRVLHAAVPNPGRDTNAIVERIHKLMKLYSLPEMGQTSCALPTRTSFLHILYPNDVPIMDAMVVQDALGFAPDTKIMDATDTIGWLFPMLWQLADRHTRSIAGQPPFERETPLRVLDMILWDNRGES